MPRGTPDFTTMNLAASPAIRDALRAHRVLASLAGAGRFFVIAHEADTRDALALADEISAEEKGSKGYHGTYTILLTAKHLTELAVDDARVVNVTVLDAQRDHRPAKTMIKVNNRGQIGRTTEHGYKVVEVITSEDIRAGDIYATGARTLSGGNHDLGLTLYRALTDFDPERDDNGGFDYHIIGTNWDTADDATKADLSGEFEYGPDVVLYRIANRERFLKTLGIADLATGAAAERKKVTGR